MEKRKLTLLVIMVFIAIMSINIYNNDYMLNKIYISFGNASETCNVELTKLTEELIIKKYADYNYLKIDKITEVKTISYKKLKNIISSTKKNKFPYGISLLNNKIVLLSEEINSNKIIDYNNNSINYDNLNSYLEKKNIKYRVKNISSLIIFSTDSKFLENGSFIKLHEVNGYNIRDIDINKNNLNNILNNAANLLMSMNLENGKYIYGYRTYNGEQINNYNILRHAGSTWSLILYYQINPSENLKNIIDHAIKYLLNNFIIDYDENISFVVEKKSNEIKLGGNALTLLMLSEYSEIFHDNKYLEIAKKIANGIIYMQEDNGEFYHILSTKGKYLEKYRTVYYDGEASLALLKFYKISNEQIYFEHAKKTVDMFLENDYTKYRDHWVSYTMNEFIKYNLEEKYIDFTLSNYTYNINKLDNNNSFGPVRLELLLSTYDSYNYILNNKPNSEALSKFDVSKLTNSININVETLFNYYINKEVAMYFDKPNLSIYGFQDIEDNFRMRIDDIQHSLIGLINYNNYFGQNIKDSKDKN